MARTLGELFPIVVAILGVYFLIAAMTTSSTVIEYGVRNIGDPTNDLDVIAVHDIDNGQPTRVDVLVGTTSTPGLYAVASALCFGSVLLWSRITPTPAPQAPSSD